MKGVEPRKAKAEAYTPGETLAGAQRLSAGSKSSSTLAPFGS